MSPRSALVSLALLGAFHGINPAMGWLFAVARGLQEGERRAVLGSLLPIALGHEASIALVVVLVAGLEAVAAPQVLRLVGAFGLIAFGVFKFVKPRSHPRWVGMRVSRPDLVVWSFLMSSAHGAGLMLFPILVGAGIGQPRAAGPVVEGGLAGVFLGRNALALTVHVAAMLLVMGAVAVVVYEKLGLGMLRRAWINLDLIWAGAVVAAGVVTLFT